MIFTDGIHLVSDVSLDELHAFARRMNLKREWFQSHPVHPHYDLTTARAVSRAVKLGAKRVTSKELVATYLRRAVDAEGDG